MSLIDQPEVQAWIIRETKVAYGEPCMYSEVTLGQRVAFAIGIQIGRYANDGCDKQWGAMTSTPNTAASA